VIGLARAALLLFGPLVIGLFPSDRPAGRAGWAALGAIAVCGGVAVAAPALIPSAALTQAGLLALLLWWRYETAGEPDQRAVLWLATAGCCVAVLLFPAGFLTSESWAAISAWTAAGALLVAITVGAVGVDRLPLRRFAVAAVVHPMAGTLYVAVVSGAATTLTILTGRTPSVPVVVVTGAVCATGHHRVVVMLRRVAERLLFGDRDEPLTAAYHVGQRLLGEPVEALHALRASLALPYVALTAPDGLAIAEAGRRDGPNLTRPLVVGGATLGALVVGLQPGERRVSPRDDEVLRVVGPAFAQILHVRALSDQLRASRSRVVTAVEDERRRLRRDLHDGLGPTLTGVAYAADAATTSVTTDPDAATAMLTAIQTNARDAIREVRRLVNGLRPPALDELGLVGAVRQQAATLVAADGHPLAVEIHADPLPVLPAAVEVAAYRIVVEAITNTARHSGTHQAEVDLRFSSGTLHVTVTDPGSARTAWQPGIGLKSMRERVEQLGGHLHAAPGPSGAVVTASFVLAGLPSPSPMAN
jgi:signal transduction histidine kinase